MLSRMKGQRRSILAAVGLGLGTRAFAPKAGARAAPSPWVEALTTRGPAQFEDWAAVRHLFPLSKDHAHLAGLLLTSHPRPVAAAVDEHRRGLDDNPALYLIRRNRELESEVRREAARYLGGRPDQFALTDSTTMGLGLIYSGLRIRSDQEMLTTEHDYHATHEALAFKAERSGASVRRIALYDDDLDELTDDGMVDRIVSALRPNTRLLAVTWVHSSTGVKIPLPAIVQAVAQANRGRDKDDRVLVGVDAVHALGVEAFRVDDLGCDFFIAGTHKWLFGPRGTGIVWGHPRAHDAVTPTIPSFSRFDGWGGRMTPGGFHSFEHRWALAQAFELHNRLGKARVQERIYALSGALLKGLGQMRHVTLRTPRREGLHAGIVCFEVQGMNPAQVVMALRRRGIVGSTTPYAPSYARLTPALFNTPEEIERALRAVGDLG
jgi:isopenicillin-N epimerase